MSANPDRKRIKRELRERLLLQTLRGYGGWNASGQTDIAYTFKTRPEVEAVFEEMGLTLHLTNDGQSVWNGPNRVRVAVEGRTSDQYRRDSRSRIHVLEHL